MEPSPACEPFRESIRTRVERLSAAAASGRKVIGYFCTYTPVEIIHAAGFVPVRIWGGVRKAEQAYSLVPSFICPFMRLSLEGALNKEFAFLSGIVQGYTCDVACGVANIFRENFPMELVHSLPLPYNDNEEARGFLSAGLQELFMKLRRIGGAVSEKSLHDSLELYDDIRSQLALLFAARSMPASPLSASDMHSVVQSYFVTPPGDYVKMLRGLLAELREAPACPNEGIPIVVSGSVVEDGSALAVIEDLGFRIVADDLCTGQRGFTPSAGTGDGPMERLMDRIMKRSGCPSRSHPRDRVPVLGDLIRASGARGVVFLFQKFCSPHLADHPRVAGALREAGVPSIALEMDEHGLVKAQVATRLETFSGMLGRMAWTLPGNP